MSEFWNNKIKPGYYDLALKSGRLSDKSPQAAWHNKTFTKISNFINNEDYLLDYACGPGTFTGQYLDLKKHPLCVDISAKQINYATNTYKGKAIYMTVNEFNFNDYHDTFDTITCLGLFEFISKEEGIELLNNFYKILKPNGNLYVTTPNFKTSMRLLEFFLNRIGSLDYSQEYKSKYTKKTFNELIKKSTFKIENIEKYMTPMIFMSIFGNRIGLILNNFFEKFFKNNYGYILFFGLKK